MQNPISFGRFRSFLGIKIFFLVCFFFSFLGVGFAEDVIVEDMVANGYGNCVLLPDKTVQCWGVNNNGQLGNETTTDSNLPVNVSGLANVSKIFPSQSHNCVLLEDETTKCWGANIYGQLGNGTTTNSLVPVNISGVQNIDEIIIEKASNNTCTLLNDKTVECWGLNNYGQLGNGTTVNTLTPVLVSNLQNVSKIVSGDKNKCALLEDKTVKCWGYNSMGELGDGTYENRTIPVSVYGLTNVIKIATGTNNTCVLLEDKTVKCWGYNTRGQLGNGTTTTSPIPVVVSNLQNVKNITVGQFFSCALLEDETVKCWGYNAHGQLGNGENEDSTTPVSVLGLQNIAKIITGDIHTCSVNSDGIIKCWGFNYYGQLGDGTTTSRNTPVQMTLGFKFASTQTAPECLESNWTSSLDPAICPASETQTKLWTKTGTCEGGVTHTAETISCTYDDGTVTVSLWQKISDTIIYFLGNVGIGTDNPQEKLEVDGNIKLSGSILSDGDICIGKCN